MAEVTDVTATKKLQMQLGVPFFIMTGFAVGILIFGTLYFGTSLGGAKDGIEPEPVAVTLAEDLEKGILQYESLLLEAALYTEDRVFDVDSDNALRELLSENKQLLALIFFDEEGKRITDLHKSRITDENLGRGQNGNLYLGVLKGRNSSYKTLASVGAGTDTTLFIATPQKSISGDLIGFVVGVIDASTLTSSLLRYADDFPLKISILESNSANSIFTVNSLTSVVPGDRPPQENLRLLFENNKKQFGYETASGLTIVAHWENIEGTQWNLVVEGFSLTGGGNAGVFIVGALLIFLFVTVAFVYLSMFNNKLLKPLKRIEKGLHFYRTGDYSEEIKVETKNELAAVAQALNTMAVNVENNTSERVSQLKKVLDRQNTDTKLLIEKDVELRETGQKLKELDAAKSMFVSVAAHQMRTPLAAVKWAIKLVMDGDVGPVNAEQVEYLNKGYTSTTRMIDLINDLLDVDKIESDKFTYEYKPESLFEIVQGIIDDLTPISNEKGVNLVFENEGENVPQINADKVKLRNALQNLIDNAVKYTIGGGDVTVKLVQDKDIFKLNISDTGIGIPKSEQGKVFGKFFRAKNAVRQQTDGSGLGLFIVKKIIEKHQGSVRFESVEKKGTTFFIEIPTLKT